MFYMPDHNLVYYEIGRCGSSAIRNKLLCIFDCAGPDSRYAHGRFSFDRRHVLRHGAAQVGKGVRWSRRSRVDPVACAPNAYSFAVVRCPFERLRSLWRKWVRVHQRRYFPVRRGQMDVGVNATFDHMATLVMDDIERNGTVINPHWRPQVLTLPPRCSELFLLSNVRRDMEMYATPNSEEPEVSDAVRARISKVFARDIQLVQHAKQQRESLEAGMCCQRTAPPKALEIIQQVIVPR